MGYVIIDNRASGGTVEEYDTTWCRHCQGVLKILHRAAEGVFCTKCGGPVHDKPECASECRPFKKQVDNHIRKIDEQVRRQEWWSRWNAHR